MRLSQEILNEESQLDNLLEIIHEITLNFFGNQFKKCTDGFTGTSCLNTCSFCYMSMYKGNGDKTNYQYSKQENLLPKALKTPEDFLDDAALKESHLATHYKIVGPEYMLLEEKFKLAIEAYKLIKQKTNLKLCASMGCLDK